MPSNKDWEDVKALAADFQRTQLSGSIQILSDRNCIEIVKKLIEMNLIEVVFTRDGKEYITPRHLIKEMQDELIVRDGRIHLTELGTILNVDYGHIEAKAGELVKSSSGKISLVLGQLVNSEYKECLAEETNDSLQQAGVITIGELTKQFDLSADFIQNIVFSRLGLTINGVQDPSDPKTIYTQNYLNMYEAKIRGVLSAVTRPVVIAQLINKYKFPEKIFNSILDSVLKNGKLSGTLLTGKTRTYVPNIYLKMQNEWVENFYKQNGYLEYDALSRIGISDVKSYLKKKPGFEDIIHLDSCCISKHILDCLESNVEECISAKSYIDTSASLPSIMGSEDIGILMDKLLKNSKLSESCKLLSETFLISNDYIDDCLKSFDELLVERAESEMKSGRLFQVFKESQASREKILQKESGSRKDERKKKGNKSAKYEDAQEKEAEIKVKGPKRNKGKQKEEIQDTDVKISDPQNSEESKVVGDVCPEEIKQKENINILKLEKTKENKEKEVRARSSKTKQRSDFKDDLEDADDDKAAFSKKDERKKKANKAIKYGGGTQGREIKMKSVKKKYKIGTKEEKNDEENKQSKDIELIFSNVNEIEEMITEKFKCFEICEAISEFMYPILNSKYKEVAKQTLTTHLIKSNAANKKSRLKKQVNEDEEEEKEEETIIDEPMEV